MGNKVLHILHWDAKFIPNFLRFLNDNFNMSEHKLMMIGKYERIANNEAIKEISKYPIIWIDSKKKLFVLLKELYKAKKIIIHGLWYDKLNLLLLFNSILLKKCYWVMWGGDFYFPEKQSIIKKLLIRKLRHFITYLEGDYEYIKKHYKAKGEYHECLMYLSNTINEKILKIAEEYEKKGKKKGTINILIGNSATEENNHIEVFEKLEKYKNEKIKIYVPLSYGDNNYAYKIIEKGKQIFNEKFIPLINFMPYEKYIKFLSTIDIAIFAHKRQQAMGNIIALLGMGKKVYLRKNTSQWKLFENLGIVVYDLNGIFLTRLDKNIAKNNKKNVFSFFSKDILIRQWQNIFDI